MQGGGGHGEQQAAQPAQQPRHRRHIRSICILIFIAGIAVEVLLYIWRPTGKTVLVLAGGGGKGAWAAGVLQGLCEKEEYRNTWTSISGTSIGALNAGILAQYKQSEQCTKGVEALLEHWNSIQSSEDIWTTTRVPLRPKLGRSAPCLDVSNTFAAGYGFFKFGGFCDPSPGRESFLQFVSRKKIQSSGMQLKVVASSMIKGGPKYFTEKSPEIVEACMASGSIAPLIYPTQIGQDIYVDGGVFHNTPLLSVLDGSVSRAIVIELSPLDAMPRVDVNLTNDSSAPSAIDGFKVIDYYLQAVYSSIVDRRELEDACQYYPHVDVQALIPEKPIGSVVDFSSAGIKERLEAGLQFVRDGKGPVDVCTVLGISRRHRAMTAMFGFDPMASWVGLVTRQEGWSAKAIHSASEGIGIFTAVIIVLTSFFIGRWTACRTAAGAQAHRARLNA